MSPTPAILVNPFIIELVPLVRRVTIQFLAPVTPPRIFARTSPSAQWPRVARLPGRPNATPAQGRPTTIVERRPRPTAVETLAPVHQRPAALAPDHIQAGGAGVQITQR
jgi:hypothetical protein